MVCALPNLLNMSAPLTLPMVRTAEPTDCAYTATRAISAHASNTTDCALLNPLTVHTAKPTNCVHTANPVDCA